MRTVGNVSQTIGQILSLGVGVALSPVPIVAVVLIGRSSSQTRSPVLRDRGGGYRRITQGG